MKIKNIFLWFFIYSFLGWVWELLYRTIIEQRLYIPGVLHGPLCPIYGVVAVIFILIFSKHQENPVLLFLLGGIITCAVEYITSYILQKTFNAIWWDYSSMRFNLNGRICLESFIFFGVLCVLLLKVIHPYINNKITKHLNEKNILFCDIIFTVILLLDILYTLFKIYVFNEFSIGVEKIFENTVFIGFIIYKNYLWATKIL